MVRGSREERDDPGDQLHSDDYLGDKRKTSLKKRYDDLEERRGSPPRKKEKKPKISAPGRSHNEKGGQTKTAHEEQIPKRGKAVEGERNLGGAGEG